MTEKQLEFGFVKEKKKQKPPNPNEVGGRFEDVVAASTDPATGAIDLATMQNFEGRFGTNGGRGCDTIDGPCSCGAWH